MSATNVSHVIGRFNAKSGPKDLNIKGSRSALKVNAGIGYPRNNESGVAGHKGYKVTLLPSMKITASQVSAHYSTIAIVSIEFNLASLITIITP